MDNEKLFFKNFPNKFPPQHQDIQPGLEYLMNPLPIFDNPYYLGNNMLKDKVAIITGGDSGIGKAIAVLFAKEGADIVIAYYNEDIDANNTKEYIEGLGRKCLIMKGDITTEIFCQSIVNDAIKYFNHIDILVNNAGVAFPQYNIEKISFDQLNYTFNVNVFSYFNMIKFCLPYLNWGSSIICTASSTAYSNNSFAPDYSSSKAAVVGLVRSIAFELIKKGIRVNAVAPGATWTPLIPASSPANIVATFGSTAPIGRAAQPFEIATSYLYLASNSSSYIVGQVIHVDGGTTLS